MPRNLFDLFLMRWVLIRFSIRHLLILFLAVSVLLAFTIPILQRSRPVTKIEHDALARINESSEGSFMLVHEYGFPEGTAFVLCMMVDCPDPDGELRRIAPHLKDLRRVDIQAAGTLLSDNGLLALHTVTSLNELLVDRTQVTDEGIQSLSRQHNNCNVVHRARNWYPPD